VNWPSPEPTSSDGGLPERIGPYRIKSILGTGAMSVVYRGEEESGGPPVAIKVGTALEEGHLTALRREIRALSRITHPGIVRIVAQGTHGDSAWFSMELLEGPTARTYFESVQHAATPDARAAAVRDALTLIARLCVPLAYLHDRGIVHGDLKPENIHLRADGTPVLLDLGLVAHSAGRSGRETLHVGGSLTGTAGYMAPEQIWGQLLDPRADLYALGCMLYEALTGIPPFDGPRLADVLFQHLHVEPSRPSRRSPGTPEWLDELVMRLLRKSRRERLGYAEIVASCLRARLGLDLPAIAEPRTCTYLYRPEIVGRDDAVAEVRSFLSEAARGRGRFVFIGGESGIGKTRLVMEAGTLAVSRRITVILGECSPITGDHGGATTGRAALEAFRPLLTLVGERCRRGGLETTERLLGARGPIVAAYEPTLSSLPGQSAHPPVQEVSPEASLERLARAIIDILAALGAEEPLLVVLDDIQWADELSMYVAVALRDAVARLPVLVLATYRDDEPDDRLREIIDHPASSAVHLPRLDAEGIRRMVGEMLALPIAPQEFVDVLFGHTEGNPFFVSEYLLLAVEHGLLVRDDAGDWCLRHPPGSVPTYRLPIPRTLQDLIRARLADLASESRALIEMASVLGRSTDEALLMQAVDIPQAAAMDGIQDLIRRRILERAEGRLAFRHGKIREVAYQGIAAGARPERHEDAARAIETRGGARLPDDDAALAHHWSRAADRDDAPAWLLTRAIGAIDRAGDRAVRTHANREAVHLFEEALRLEDRLGEHGDAPRVRRARWEHQLGEAHFRLGHPTASAEHLVRALATRGERVASHRSALAARLVVEAVRQVGRSLHLPSRRPRVDVVPGLDVARTHELLGFVQLLMMQRVPSLISNLRSLSTAERYGPPSVLATSSAVVGMSLGTLLGMWVAERYFRRGLETARILGDGYCLGRVAHMRGFYMIGQAAWDSARDALAEARTAFEAVGDIRWRDSVVLTTGNLHYIHRHSEGLAQYEEAGRSSAERGDMQSQAWAALGCAVAHVAVGNVTAARESFEAMDAVLAGRLERLGDRTSEFSAHGTRAVVLLRSGDSAAARRAAEAAVDLACRLPLLLYHAFPGHVHVAEVGLELRERALRNGEDDPELARLCALALGNLETYARFFPIGRPALALWRGRAHWIVGARARAYRAWRHAAVEAERLDMPFESALAHQELGHRLTDERERERHLASARARFADVGLTYVTDRVAHSSDDRAGFVAETIA
jgi:hypothetical protein